MDDESKIRFEGFDRRLEGLDARFDDVKWYIGGATGIFTLIFSVLTIVASLNFNSQKEDLGRFEQNVRTDLGTAQQVPQVRLLGSDLQELSGQDVPGTFQSSNRPDFQELLISFDVSNVGRSWSGKMFLKFYSSTLQLVDATSDEQRAKYSYEDFVSADNLAPNDIPGKFSSVWHVRLDAKSAPPGRYDALVRVFYGVGESAQAPITVVVK